MTSLMKAVAVFTKANSKIMIVVVGLIWIGVSLMGPSMQWLCYTLSGLMFVTAALTIGGMVLEHHKE